MADQNSMDQPDMNSCQSKIADSDVRSTLDSSVEPRAAWLAKTSLYLAIFIEIFPTEADVIFIAYNLQSMPLFILIKLSFWTIILFPLFLYIVLNGWRSIQAASGKVIAIFIILFLNLIMHGFTIMGIPWQ
jgi:hypothetical protein